MKKLIYILMFALYINGYSQTWSSVGTGVNSDIYCQTVFNGELIAGGDFTIAGSIPCNKLAKWNGIAWDTLPGTIGFDNASAAEVFNSELFIGRGSIPSIYKWNGTNWSAVGSGLNSVPVDLIVYNNELYAGGLFTIAGGISAEHIARWNGNTWATIGAGMNNDVLCLGIYNNELYAGGRFTTAGSNVANHIAKWNGTYWVSLGAGLDNSAYSMAVYNGKLYIGGNFTTAGGNPARGIASWDGTSWNSVGGGVDSGFGVISFSVYNSELYAGGLFSSIGTIAANNIAKWNDVNWSVLGTTTNGVSGSVAALTVYNSELYIGGTFDSAGTIAVNNIARWSTTTGINNYYSNNSITISPNPFTNEFLIIGTKQAGELVLFDLTGNEIMRQNTLDTQTQINTTSLSQGIYLLKYYYQNKSTNLKLMKF